MTVPENDDDLLVRLARIADEVDPAPDLVAESARAAFATRGLDEELATLLRDSDLAASGVRGTGPRLLTFETHSVTLELQIETDGRQVSVAGLVVGPADSVAVQTVDAEPQTATVDEHGWFRVEGLPVRPFRIRVTGDGADAVTSWVNP